MSRLPVRKRPETAQKFSLEDFPPIDPRLIDALDREFPDQAPTGLESEAELRVNAGSVKVIRFLRRILHYQTTTQDGATNVLSFRPEAQTSSEDQASASR